MNRKTNKKEPQKVAVRVLCLLLAVLLVLSSIAAIFGLFN